MNTDATSTAPPDLSAALQPILERLFGVVGRTYLRPWVDALSAALPGDPRLQAEFRELGQTLVRLTTETEPQPTPTPPIVEPAVVVPATLLPAVIVPVPAPEPSPVVASPPAPHTNSTPPPPVVQPVPPVASPPRVVIPRRPDYVEPEPEPNRPEIIRHDAGSFGTSWHAHPPTDEDLPLIAQRCRLKAEATRWTLTRQHRIDHGADFEKDIEPRDRDLFDRAKSLPDCYLWMNHRKGPMPTASQYNHLASCFDVAATAADMLYRVVQCANPEEHLERALYLAAEAQSALRIAVADFGSYTDSDQLRVFIWVRETAARQRIWISRYMRQDDVAEPTVAVSLLGRIQDLSRGIQTFQDREKKRKKAQGKLKYHLKRVQTQPSRGQRDDWLTIVATVNELVQDGVPPSNPELRDQLLPVLDHIPEEVELPKNFNLVLREIDRYLAATASRTNDEEASEAPSVDIQRAAELLRGRALVLIGGVRRPEAAEAIKAALELSELHWVEGREHSSYYAFEPDVANPEVAAVVLAIRWSSHGFGEVKNFCDKYDKPLVRLPGGYNPNQVAYHILTQIGGRLAARSPA